MDQMEIIWITPRMGAKLRQAREDKGLSQSELSVLVNASQTQIAHYEKGEHEMPLSRLFDLAQVLGMSAVGLYDE
jgi:transcriptional regulator with XRE-family HTH domain